MRDPLSIHGGWYAPKGMGICAEEAGDTRCVFSKFAWKTYEACLHPVMTRSHSKRTGFWATTDIIPLFGMTGIPNPRFSRRSPISKTSSIEAMARCTRAPERLISPSRAGHSFLFQTDLVAIIFNPDVHVGDQLKNSRAVLKNCTVSRQRPSLRNWRVYLRVLDAREAGLTDQQIAKLIFIHDHLADPKRANRILKRAEKIRDNFPL